MVSFLVEGIEELVRELTRRGATFAPLPGAATFAGREGDTRDLVTDSGSVKSAFVKDAEGNLLALNELVT